MATASYIRSTIDEYVQAGASAREASDLQDFASKPLVVLPAGIGNDATHSAAQTELATLSTNGARRVIADADHLAMVAEQAGAARTTQAILDVVSSVRRGDR